MPHTAAPSVPVPELHVERLVPTAAWCLPYLLGWSLFLGVEFGLSSGVSDGPQSPIEWLLGADDRLVFFVLLLAAPVFWWLGRFRYLRRGNLLVRSLHQVGVFIDGPAGQGAIARWRPVGLSLLVACVSLAASWRVAERFDDLPPAYHDEYSYLFQAETFMAGRISFPSHEQPRLFDQMHVLNEGRFASRYFPGAGLWMAPFVAAGHPYWGQWLAGGLCATLMFWIGRELAGDAGGLAAGLLTALSPGMALFSNLLLAHHPTLVGLGMFVLGFLRMVRGTTLHCPAEKRKCVSMYGWAAFAGIGLAFAALCRPLTAAGMALPYGVYLIWWAARGGCLRFQGAPTRARRLLALVALGVPLVAASVGMFCVDRVITGSGWTTPYSVYLDLHTPRHVYGFNNVTRGEKRLGPRVIDNYDKWAENLTSELAARNAAARLTASWKWTLGILPLTLTVGGGLVLWRRLSSGTWLIFAGILSLHAVHIPYWFVGMEDHHYVFESGPLWAVLTAVISIEAARAWRAAANSALTLWWGTFVAAAVAMNFTVSSGVWSSPYEQGIGRVLYARQKHGRFAALVSRMAVPTPALVLVESDPGDRHIDYVTNSPALSGPVLIAHYLPQSIPILEVKRLFPDRALFLYRAKDDEWSRLE